jgi:hypothetical protein
MIDFVPCPSCGNHLSLGVDHFQLDLPNEPVLLFCGFPCLLSYARMRVDKERAVWVAPLSYNVAPTTVSTAGEPCYFEEQ